MITTIFLLFLFSLTCCALCVILTILALKRRCQQIKFWAIVAFASMAVSILLNALIIIPDNEEKQEKTKYCKDIPNTSAEYYLNCVDDWRHETYCHQVDAGILEKTILYCEYCVPRTFNIANSSSSNHEQHVFNENYKKCYDKFN